MDIFDAQIDNNVVNNSPGNGGGIHIGGDGSLRIRFGSVSGNSAGSEGGGIWNASGTLDITGTIISDNTASGDDADQGGGGLYNNGGGSIIVRSGTRIVNNTADGASGSGGGILNNMNASLTISGAIIMNNEANRAGGGIEDASGNGSSFAIIDSRIDSNIVNTSPGNGGGIHIGGNGNLTVRVER